MELRLVAIGQENKVILMNLYQFYEYDFSKYTKRDLDKNGRFEVNIDYYWEGDGRWNPFFIELSGTIVGFLVVLFENMDVDPDPKHVIYDFMVLPKYRRAGIGRAAAIEAFKKYKADWIISQMDNNTPAITFWRDVLEGYKGSNFTERYRPDRKKYVQEFSTKN